MPNPLYLKVMNTTKMEYNTFTSEEKDEFEKEAKTRIASMSDDPVVYTELTDNTDVPEFKRSRKKKGDN